VKWLLQEQAADVDKWRLILPKPLRYGFYLRVELLTTNPQG